MKFVEIFDVSDTSLKIYWAVSIIVGVISLFIQRTNTSKESIGIPHIGLILSWVFIVIGVCLGVKSIRDYRSVKLLYMEGRFKTVEGVVEKFDPMPYGGHKAETFEVGNVYFEISDFNGSSYGYNNTKSHGGAIDSGKHVRIAYYFEDGRNVILRLEARN